MSLLPTSLKATDSEPVIEAYREPFDFSSSANKVNIVSLKEAKRTWSLCVLVPHMKDEYWISVHSGFRERARELDIHFDWHEAGGYLKLNRQIRQLRKCASDGHDLIVLGAVSSDAPALLDTIREVSASVPVIAFVNELKSDLLSAKVAVSWRKMGEMLGRQVVRDLPRETKDIYNVSLVSGPSESGWAPILEAGLRAGLQSERIRFGRNLRSDSDYHNQFIQVEKAVSDCQPNHIIIGSAPAAEAAMSLVRLISCSSKPKIYSTYYSLAVKRGLASGKIEAAVVDFAVLQGWLAVEQSVRVLEGSMQHRQLGPKIEIATPGRIPLDRWSVISR